jgi:hypothetical protein
VKACAASTSRSLLTVVPILLLPPSAFDIVASWAGNLVVLMLSAGLNVAAIWFVRRLSKRNRDRIGTGPPARF